jgi:hypothetical protein
MKSYKLLQQVVLLCNKRLNYMQLWNYGTLLAVTFWQTNKSFEQKEEKWCFSDQRYSADLGAFRKLSC